MPKGRPTIHQIVSAAEAAGVVPYVAAVAGEIEGVRDEEAWAKFGNILAQAFVLASLSGIVSMRDRLRFPDVPRGTRRTFSRESFAAPWDESKHPRGQPENAGQFGPGGGGTSSGPEGPSPEQVEALKERRAAIDAKQGRVEAAKEKVKEQVAAAGSTSMPQRRVGSEDVKTIKDLEWFSETADWTSSGDGRVGMEVMRLNQSEAVFTHAVRFDSEIDSILRDGIRPGQNTGRVFASNAPLVRDRGSGFVVFRADERDAEFGIDVVEPGLSYREVRFNRTIAPHQIEKVVRVVGNVREDRIAAYALKNQGLDNDEVRSLPPRYRSWFSLDDSRDTFARVDVAFPSPGGPSGPTFSFGASGGELFTAPFAQAIASFERRVPQLATVVKTLMNRAVALRTAIVEAEKASVVSILSQRSKAIEAAISNSFWAADVSIDTTNNLKTLLAQSLRGFAGAKPESGLERGLNVGEFIAEARVQGAANLTVNRLRTIYRNATNGAYNDGRAEVLRAPEAKAAAPLVMIREIRDKRTRGNPAGLYPDQGKHWQMNGYVGTVEDLQRRGLIPPCGHNCRGGIRPVSSYEAKQLDLLDPEGNPDPAKIRKYNGDREAIVERGEYPDPGWRSGWR